MITVCYLSLVLCAFAQDNGSDMSEANLEARISAERESVSYLQKRRAQAQREQSLLTNEIEQELGRISKLNHSVRPAPSSAETSVSWKIAEPAAAQPVASAPPVPAAKQEPALAVSPSTGLAVDAESQAEIDKLVEMREKLISERDSLEQMVKPAPGAL